MPDKKPWDEADDFLSVESLLTDPPEEGSNRRSAGDDRESVRSSEERTQALQQALEGLTFDTVVRENRGGEREKLSDHEVDALLDRFDTGSPRRKKEPEARTTPQPKETVRPQPVRPQSASVRRTEPQETPERRHSIHRERPESAQRPATQARPRRTAPAKPASPDKTELPNRTAATAAAANPNLERQARRAEQNRAALRAMQAAQQELPSAPPADTDVQTKASRPAKKRAPAPEKTLSPKARAAQEAKEARLREKEQKTARKREQKAQAAEQRAAEAAQSGSARKQKKAQKQKQKAARQVKAAEEKAQRRAEKAAATSKNPLVNGVRTIRAETAGMGAKERGKYLLAQIGPTVREIQADPVRKERAYQIILWVLAILLAFHMTSCVNDVFGFSRSSRERPVTLDQNMTTNQVIGRLDRAGLIKHGTFCKLFIASTGNLHGKNVSYIPGEYYMSRDMGLENMLLNCQSGRSRETVQLTFPEGFTIDQMAEKLEDNKVCSRTDFYKACDSVKYKYPFLKSIDDVNERYRVLEGFLYPDTYEFYMGQSASSVVDRMLSNFNDKWTEAYAKRAEELNLSVDDVVTLASIIQKEDSDPKNMTVIASVFFNRLNSAAFPSLQSDATNYYCTNFIKPHCKDQPNLYKAYVNRYSTYKCKGLPVGAICSPGEDAIKAVLWPENTGYYFFAHDSDGNLYVARTTAEQSYNLSSAAEATENADDLPKPTVAATAN